MDYQNLDNQFHQRLYHAEVPPPPAVWANVEKTLRERKRKRAFAWIFGSGLAVAGLCAVLWEGQFSAANQAEHLAQKGSVGEPAPALHSTSEKASQADESASVGQINVVADAPSVRHFTPKSAPKGQGVLAKKLDGYFSKNSEVADNHVFGQDKQPVVSPVMETQNALRAVAGAQSSGLNLLQKNLPAVASTADQPPYHFAPIKPLWRKKKDAKHCYSFTQYRPVWLLDGYTGFARPIRTLVATTPDFQGYAAQRDKTEHFSFGMTGGLRGSLVWGPLVLRTGLHYTQFTETFENEQINSIRTTIVIDSVLVNGQWVREEKTVREFGSKFTRIYNRFGMLDVPLLAGAEMRLGRLGLSLNGGAAMNVLFTKRGSILSPTNNPVDNQPGIQNAAPIFKTNTGFSLVGNAQMFWHLAPRTRVFVEPYFQHILKPVTQASYPLAQRYNIMGVNAGVTRILD